MHGCSLSKVHHIDCLVYLLVVIAHGDNGYVCTVAYFPVQVFLIQRNPSFQSPANCMIHFHSSNSYSSLIPYQASSLAVAYYSASFPFFQGNTSSFHWKMLSGIVHKKLYTTMLNSDNKKRLQSYTLSPASVSLYSDTLYTY